MLRENHVEVACTLGPCSKMVGFNAERHTQVNLTRTSLGLPLIYEERA